MERRTALIALFSIPFGAFGFKKAEAGSAILRIPLDQWTGVVIEHKGKTVSLSSSEIFEALCKK